jgi:hypothetical protein
MPETSRKLGHVKITQIQPNGLKHIVSGNNIYDPSRIVAVPLLYLSSFGVEGQDEQGERSLDIHHADHSKTRNKGVNGISIGFTSHYQVMRTRFGDHMQDGVAGENIIIECQEEIWLPDLGKKVEIHNPETGKIVSLDVTKIAAPCDEFSHFAAESQGQRQPANELKETLQFLGDGRRGFLLSLGADQENGLVQPGDIVYAIS